MKKLVKTTLKFSMAIAALVLTAPVIVLSAIWAFGSVNDVAFLLLGYLIAGALLGLLIGYRLSLGSRTSVIQQNVNLSTRLKLAWSNIEFLQEKMGKLHDTMREYETLIRDMNRSKLGLEKEVADLEKALVELMEAKGKLAGEVSRLTAKYEAEKTARIESAAKSGKKILHQDLLREKLIEHLQKSRARVKTLLTRIEILEDELGLLRHMAEEYWRLKDMYEPRAKDGISITIIPETTLISLPEIIRNEGIKEEEILKEAV